MDRQETWTDKKHGQTDIDLNLALGDERANEKH